jgi:hypothetical protein
MWRKTMVLAVAALTIGFAALVAVNSAEQPRAEGRNPPLPRLSKTLRFDTPEADRILASMQVFPRDNPWNQDVSKWPLHPNSRNIIASIGNDKPLRANTDMCFILVPPDQKRVPAAITEYPDESDKGPFPLPDELPIEGWPANYRGQNLSLDDVQRDKPRAGGDRHAIVVDPEAGKLYEFFQMLKTDRGWQAAQASVFDLKSNVLRPDGWTSADAAGLPIFPAVVRYDELQRGMVGHAMRVTARRTRRAYVHPATHFASRLDDPNLPRMGERIRLKADYPIGGFSPNVQAVLKGLKKHGMFVADNGLEWCLSVAPDPRIKPMHEELRRVKGSAFEVVEEPKPRNKKP